MSEYSESQILEWAARANGGLVYVEGMGWIFEDENGNRGKWWDPLNDDGDALRLAVKLQLNIFNEHVENSVAYCGDKQKIEFPYIVAVSETDRKVLPSDYRVTRVAIVFAAAEIGKVS